MKKAIGTIQTVCSAMIFMVSGATAHDTANAKLEDQGAQVAVVSTVSTERVSIIDYIKALETISAYHALHGYENVIPGVTKVSLSLEPQPSYNDLITSKLRSWASLRIDELVRQRQANVFADVTSKDTGADWRYQEFIREFNRGRLMSYRDPFSMATIQAPLTYSSYVPRSR